MTAHDWHHQVEEDQAGRLLGAEEEIERLFPVLGEVNGVAGALEHEAQHLPDIWVVIDDEHRLCLRHDPVI